MGDVDDRFDLGRIAGFHDRHVGNSAHDRDIIDGLMGDAPGSSDAGKEAHKSNLEVGVGHGHLQLIQRAAIEEHRERVKPGLEALPRQTRGETEHVLLRHPHGEETVRVGVSPLAHLAGVGQVCAENENLWFVGGPVDEVVHVGTGHDLDVRTSAHA